MYRLATLLAPSNDLPRSMAALLVYLVAIVAAVSALVLLHTDAEADAAPADLDAVPMAADDAPPTGLTRLILERPATAEE